MPCESAGFAFFVVNAARRYPPKRGFTIGLKIDPNV